MPVPWFGFTRGFLDHFALGKQLGAGAYGSTHIATEKATAQKYAVKILPKGEIQTQEDREAVDREVKILRMVSPPNDNIVTMYGVFEDDSNVYILLELCTGGELFERLAKMGTFSEADAAALIRQILKVTAECHNNGIAHRDLKPENFLYVSPESNIIKAIDFGLSDFFTPTKKFTNITGSPYYVAPEVLKKNSTHTSDVWSVGVIAYVLLCGGPPFYGESDDDLFNSIMNDQLDLESDPWPTVSEPAKDIIRRLMMKDPKLRLSASQALSHPWVREGGSAPDIPLCYDVVTSLSKFSKQSKLKRLFFTIFANQLGESKQIQSLTDQFKTIDRDGSGMISFAEFKAAVESIKMGEMGQRVFDPQTINDMCSSLDSDGDGTIDYKEFLAAAMQTLKLEKDQNWHVGVSNAFKVLDNDGNGYLTADELGDALGLSTTETASMMLEIDNDGDGKIDLDEFKQVLATGLQSARGSLDLTRAEGPAKLRAGEPGPPAAAAPADPTGGPPQQQQPAMVGMGNAQPPQEQLQPWMGSMPQAQPPQQQPGMMGNMPQAQAQQQLYGMMGNMPQAQPPQQQPGMMGNMFAHMHPAMAQQMMMMPPAQRQMMMLMMQQQTGAALGGVPGMPSSLQPQQHQHGQSQPGSLPQQLQTQQQQPNKAQASPATSKDAAGARNPGQSWEGMQLVSALRAELAEVRQELRMRRKMQELTSRQLEAVAKAKIDMAERRASRDALREEAKAQSAAAATTQAVRRAEAPAALPPAVTPATSAVVMEASPSVVVAPSCGDKARRHTLQSHVLVDLE